MQAKQQELLWIKAHVGHDGNERADQLAREAVKNSQVGVNTPQSWACYKAQLKEEIYSELHGNKDGQMIMHTG